MEEPLYNQSLLDHFAGLAMQSLMLEDPATIKESPGITCDDRVQCIAITSYTIAMRMLEERENWKGYKLSSKYNGSSKHQFN